MRAQWKLWVWEVHSSCHGGGVNGTKEHIIPINGCPVRVDWVLSTWTRIKDRLLFALPRNLERIRQASNFCRNVHPVKLVSQTRKSPLQRETCKVSRSPVTGGLVSEKWMDLSFHTNKALYQFHVCTPLSCCLIVKSTVLLLSHYTSWCNTFPSQCILVLAAFLNDILHLSKTFLFDNAQMHKT